MILAHSIALDPTEAQTEYFCRASGVARFAYNFALAEWKRQYEAGEKPSANALKAKWNAVRREKYPWSLDVTKCAGSHAIMNLGNAFANFFRDLKKSGGRKARYPRFKKKGVHDAFALWNDQFRIDGKRVHIPKLGWVRMRELLRFQGKIMGAVISRKAGRWFLAVQVELPQAEAPHSNFGSIVGIDLGVSTLLTLSRHLADGTVKIANPKARKVYLKRQARLQRRISRQEATRRKANARKSNRQVRRQALLSRLHYRVACVRKDAIHKATTAITTRFGNIVLENLNVTGMGKNHALAGAVFDAAFGEIRRQVEYKAAMKGGRVILADRFFASSKTCSACGSVTEAMPLSVREWECQECGTAHDRDINAARNLELVAQAMREPLRHGAAATHGEIAALAASQGAVKLRSVNRELNRGCTYAPTF
jgi:putative transposase